MKDSRERQRKQTTSYEYEGLPQKTGVELLGYAEALSQSPASDSKKDDNQGREERLLETIISRDNLNLAYKKVKSNGGSHGVDGMQVDALLPFLKQHGEAIRQSIRVGSYCPQPVRRVEISKPDGGVRQLGIPTVLDRLIQQAIAQVLNTVFDPGFSPNSYGFRPGKSAHQAILAARAHMEEGYNIVVDMDLEKFFDHVNHDKLMSLVARKVRDKRVLKLIRQYLESGIMTNGIKVNSVEGTPQGGPLSPLLANIMLDELDKELERRGHRFCRYADDCNIYVRSKKAGMRVMESATRYIEGVLKLKVNQGKSAVDQPNRRKFLGFSFYNLKGSVRSFVHRKSVDRLKAKVKEITSRSNGKSIEWRKDQLNKLIVGWMNYFCVADMRKLARELDQWIRRRIRMCYWKQWMKVKTRRINLIKLGIQKHKAWEFANTRKGYWRISNSPILTTSLTNELLDKQGFMSLTKYLSKVS